MKQMNLTYNDVLWRFSWINLVMLMAELAGDNPTTKDDNVQEVTPAELYKIFNNGS